MNIQRSTGFQQSVNNFYSPQKMPSSSEDEQATELQIAREESILSFAASPMIVPFKAQHQKSPEAWEGATTMGSSNASKQTAMKTNVTNFSPDSYKIIRDDSELGVSSRRKERNFMDLEDFHGSDSPVKLFNKFDDTINEEDSSMIEEGDELRI